MDFAQAIPLIEKSSHIGIFLSQKHSFDTFASAEVFVRTISGKKKSIGLLSAPTEFSLEIEKFFPSLYSKPSLPKELIVSIDVDSSKISELRYEKNSAQVEIILSPKDENIHPNSISSREGEVLCDLGVSFGIQDIEDYANCGVKPDFFTENPIINFDNNPKNKNFGEVNLLTPDNTPLCQTIYEFLTLYKGSVLSPECAELLLAGMLSVTDNLQSAGTSHSTLLAASELMRLGADRDRAAAAVRTDKGINALQLIGRASVRTKMEKNPDILWSFIPKEDFLKTSASTSEIHSVMNYLRQNFPPQKAIVTLWENPSAPEKKISATVFSDSPILSQLQKNPGGVFESPFFTLSTQFLKFPEAEDFVRSLLKSVL